MKFGIKIFENFNLKWNSYKSLLDDIYGSLQNFLKQNSAFSNFFNLFYKNYYNEIILKSYVAIICGLIDLKTITPIYFIAN